MTKKVNKENYGEIMRQIMKEEEGGILKLCELFDNAIPEGTSVFAVAHASLIMVARAAMRLNDDESIRTGVKYYQTQLASVVEQTLEDMRRAKDGAN